MATGGEKIPDHYFIPMSKMDIDSYLYYNALKICNPVCTEWPENVCCGIYMDIERYNLYYVNGIINYDQLMAGYKNALDALKAMPRLPGIKEQLKNSVNFAVAAVAGFFAAGPVGLFTGAASAVAKIIADEKARRGLLAQSVLDKNIEKVQGTMDLKQEAKLKNYALVGGGILAAAGVVYWMLTD
jgi:hypothetical protein